MQTQNPTHTFRHICKPSTPLANAKRLAKEPACFPSAPQVQSCRAFSQQNDNNKTIDTLTNEKREHNIKLLTICKKAPSFARRQTALFCKLQQFFFVSGYCKHR